MKKQSENIYGIKDGELSFNYQCEVYTTRPRMYIFPINFDEPVRFRAFPSYAHSLFMYSMYFIPRMR